MQSLVSHVEMLRKEKFELWSERRELTKDHEVEKEELYQEYKQDSDYDTDDYEED